LESKRETMVIHTLGGLLRYHLAGEKQMVVETVKLRPEMQGISQASEL
jgi:hypothetical protein